LTLAQTLTLYAEHYPPYSIDHRADADIMYSSATNSDSETKLDGMDIELIRQAYSAMGLETKFEFSPWKRVMRDVELGNILGGISCRRTESRKAFDNYSDPVSQSRLAFMTRANFQGEVPQRLEGLNALKVVIVSGYSQQSILDFNGVKYTAASSLTQGLNLVKHRDQDVFFAGWEGSAFEAKRLGYLDELKFTPALMEGVKKFHVCFSKKYAESDKWRLILNEGLVKIKEQGLMAMIKQKYGINNIND
jgi:polar amino acid transport system substrate-binding protein